MFLPEIYMHLQRLHSTPADAPADPRGDDESLRPDERLLSVSTDRHAAAAPRRADEWDEWKSVRDVA